MRPAALALPSWLVWGLALLFIFGGLGSFAILDNNEGLYAEIPREMLAAGDWRAWVIPHLDGLPYMEKPPLLYWLTALSFALFGQAEWVARLVPALASLSCVAMLMRFGRLVGHETAGRLAALMFVTGIGVLAMSRVLMFDMLLTAWLTAALLNTWLFLAGAGRGRLRWAYAALALAVLTKGLVALILFSLVLGATLVATRLRTYWRTVWKLLDPLGLLLFALLVLPWHVAAAMVEPVFPWFYFYNEHVLRFLGQRQPHDYYGGPWWYYLPRMAIYLFPWCFLLAWRLAPPAAATDGSDGSDGTVAARDLRRFLLLAWLLPLLFFSISTAKANYYLVAVMPFAALHLALMVCARDWQHSRLRLAPSLLLALACAALAAVAASRSMPEKVAILGFSESSFLAGLFGGAAILALLPALLAARRSSAAIPAFVLVSAWFAAGLGLALQAMEPYVSTRQLAQYLQQTQAGRQVVLFRAFEKKSSLAFYLARVVPVVDSVSADLYWGNRLRANEVIWTREQALEKLSRDKLALVVTDEHRASFEAWGAATRFRAVARHGDVTVYVN
ncbi:MAG: hypothetical protein JWP36_942 [Paucimonas sp.]|nr:hypothetical protein [Paucimonas sp.]